MRLSCIQAYKVDATKAVQRTDVVDSVVQSPAQEPCHSQTLTAAQPDCAVQLNAEEDGEL